MLYLEGKGIIGHDVAKKKNLLQLSLIIRVKSLRRAEKHPKVEHINSKSKSREKK